jgi:hypothetical protein
VTDEANVQPSVSSPTLSRVGDRHTFREFALKAAPAAAAVANYCDHVEHNEVADVGWVVSAGDVLRTLSIEFAESVKVDLIDLYAKRLRAIEGRNALARPGGYDGHGAALGAETWRDLQLVQADHDRYYHADVIGLTKAEQLRHYALHLTKIVGAFAEASDPGDLVSRRLPDTLLFALKLQTVMGKRLPDEDLPQIAPRSHAATRAAR